MKHNGLIARHTGGYLRHAPIKRKLTTIFFIITCISIGLFASSAIIFASRTVSQRQQRDVASQLEILNQKLQIVLDTTEDLSRIISRHPTAQTFLKESVGIEQSLPQNLIPESLAFTRFIEAAFLRNMKNEPFSLFSQMEYLNPDPSDLLLFDGYLKLFERDRQLVWRGPILAPYRRDNERTSVFVVYKLIYDEESDTPLGICELYISERKIASVYADSNIAYDGELFIANDRGSIISHLDKEALYTDISQYDFFEQMNEHQSDTATVVRGKDQAGPVAFVRNKKTDWFLIFAFGVDYYMLDIVMLLMRIIIAGAVCLLVTFVVTGRFSAVISQPIRELTDVVKFVGEGNLDARADVRGDDEIAVLSREFNKMVLGTENLLKRIIKSQETLRLHELTALHSQINPHFLYNTLESVCALAEMEKTDAVVSMVNSLSTFYRGVLGNSTQIISLQQEVEIVKNYLEIMAFRYGDLVTYDIDVPVLLNNIQIPKFTLQPLVENALYHGIKEKANGGTICIMATKDTDSSVIVAVQDDGVGMAIDLVDRVLSGESESTSGRFGLRVSDERIKLLFGEEYGISINTTVGEGTRVNIKVPCKDTITADVWSRHY